MKDIFVLLLLLLEWFSIVEEVICWFCRRIVGRMFIVKYCGNVYKLVRVVIIE